MTAPIVDRPEIAQLLDLDPDDREKVLGSMSQDDAERILREWKLWARPKQLAPPGTWRAWLRMAGRGEGKTRSGAEWVHEKARTSKTGRGALIAPTYSDARDVMIEGVSGLLETAPRGFAPVFEPSRWRLIYPNGVRVKVFSAEKPNRLRGPQHEFIWIDEVAAFQYPREVYDMAMFGLRIGPNPQCMITTTPKPIELLVDLTSRAVMCTELRTARPGDEILQRAIGVALSAGTTYENRANLAASWFSDIISRYEGTRLGDQELLALLLTDVPGALWNTELLQRNRIVPLDAQGKVVDVKDAIGSILPDMHRIVVAIDPPARSKGTVSEAGIVAAGRGMNKHGYVLADRSGVMSPEKWARTAIDLYYELEADRIIAEINNGGEMVEHTIKSVDPKVPVKVVTATRGKMVRAEPIAAFDEQGKIHHVGTFGAMESQMCTWVPDSGLASPDRMDARVWALSDLMLRPGGIVVA